jgi:hypothetical protein
MDWSTGKSGFSLPHGKRSFSSPQWQGRLWNPHCLLRYGYQAFLPWVKAAGV